MTWRLDITLGRPEKPAARASCHDVSGTRESTVVTSASAFSLRWIALRIEGPMHCPARSSKFAWMARRAATATETAAARVAWRVGGAQGRPSPLVHSRMTTCWKIAPTPKMIGQKT